MSQSKLSEALALTLMRYKEIDRDTIEALCKRAAGLETELAKEQNCPIHIALAERNTELATAEAKLQQMSEWRSNDNRRERKHNADMQRILGALGLRVLDTAECAVTHIEQLRSDVDQARERFAQRADAEHALSNAYVRLRTILGALNAGEAPTAEQVWAHTEEKAQQLVKSNVQLQWALRDLLAQTRDLQDSEWDGGSFGEGGYTEQTPALKNAIATADALVGADVTEQFPIADEPLNRRIQELEVALAAEQKKKQGRVFIGEGFIQAGFLGEPPRVQLGQVPTADETGAGITTAGERQGPIAKATEEAHATVQKALRERLEDLIVKPAAELKAEMQPRRWSEHSLRALIRDVLDEAQTVDVPADFELHTVVTINGPVEATNKLVKEIIAQEMRPGGRIHSALINR